MSPSKCSKATQAAKKPTRDQQLALPPEYITDKGTGRTYQVGKLLGIGGYAACYEIRDVGSNEQFACKIVSNSMVTGQEQMEKIGLEMVLQHGMRHANIVQLHTYFQDDLNLYIILELCTNGSLHALVKRREVLTELEARYFLRQILMGIRFLHSRNMVHRDIKPANLFIHENMTLKIGDFGLATLFNFYGQRKRTVCGTPNYVPPEILNETGHSFEADMWCVGVILYQMLIGYAPFQKIDLEQTYEAIRDVSYTIPPDKISVEAKKLIESILVADPSKRAKLHHILGSEFMNKEPIPITLPPIILNQRVQFAFRDSALNARYGHGRPTENKKQLDPVDAVTPKNINPTADAPPMKKEDEQERKTIIPINKMVKGKKATANVKVEQPTDVPVKRSRRISERNMRRALSTSASKE